MPDVFISKDKKPETDQTRPDLSSNLQTEKQRRRFKHHTHNSFAAYSLYPDPDKINFETKKDKEEVILFLRQHPIVNLKWILLALVLIFAPLFLNFFPLPAFLPGNFQFIAVLIWYLITMAYILENFFNWYYNVYIVTNERIVDIDFNNFIYKEVSAADIDKIQDVTFKMGGVIRTIFNYSDVIIQTAAEVPQFDFLAVPNPDKVVKIIQELQMSEEEEKFGHK